MDKNIDGKYKIVASLKYGGLFSTSIVILGYFLLLLCLGLLVALITAAIFEPEYRLTYLLCLLMPILGIVTIPWVLISYYRISSEIKLWLKDAVYLTATSNAVNSYKYNHGGFVPTTSTKLMLAFTYNGKQIIKYSGRELPGDSPQTSKYGYSKVFTKYVNREIPILYSPKYDQVLLLKETKNK